MDALAAWSTRKRAPKHIDVAALPPLIGNDDEILPAALVRKLLVLLGQMEEPDDLLESVRRWATPKSADAWAWATFEAWRRDRYKRAGKLSMLALRVFGGDRSAERLPDAIVACASAGRSKDVQRAGELVQLLGAVESAQTPTALLRLSRAALPIDLELLVERTLASVAETRGMSVAALEDEASPLDEELFSFTKPKSMPKLISGAPLPELRFANGSAVEPRYRDAILRAMMGEGAGRKVLRRVARKLDPSAAEDLALELFVRWEAADWNGRWSWVLAAISAFGGDRAALVLEPYLVQWPLSSDRGRKRAIAALSVFREIGTDTALLVLLGLGQKEVLPSVAAAAASVLRSAARDRKIGVGELGDRITPDCGLDDRGSRVFDYGARRFEVFFDDHFEPRCRDDEGEVYVELPAAAAGDDAEAAERARSEWHLLSGQLAEVAKVQSARLEQAMVGERRWTIADFRRFLFGHPLMINFTRRLVWGVFDASGGLQLAFRTAEDRTFVDLADDAVELPERGLIGLAHPLHLDEDARVRWAEHVADYEIIPPFSQLGREVYVVTDEERPAQSCTRLADRSTEAKVVHDTFIDLAWTRDPSFMRMFFEKEFEASSIVARAHLDPGIHAGSSDSAARQHVAKITFSTGAEMLALGDVLPVVFSEALHDVWRVVEAGL